MAVVRKHVAVRGHVQGVFFRDSLRRRASGSGVAGWVRNTAGGALEAVFEGEPHAVDRLVEFCRAGPRGAAVEEVDVRDEEPEGMSGFRVTG